MDLSIVIPVYNAEQYVKNCLDHILLHKEIKFDFEIIIIDDGSTDRSLSLINEYISIPFLKVISCRNQGVAAARNQGIRLATGEYIVFLDVDDFLNIDFLNTFIFTAKQKNAEILILDYEIGEIYGKTVRKSILRKQPECGKVYAGREILSSFYGYEGYMWIAIYNKDFILAHNLFFDEKVIIWEDLDLMLKILIQAKRVVYLPNVLYYYIRRVSSLSCGISLEKTNSALQVLLNIRKLAYSQKQDIPLKNYLDDCYSHHLYQTIKHILRARFSEKQDQILFQKIIERRMLPVKITGNLKERFDKILLNNSLNFFIFWFRLKKGLWLKKI